jgi:hypothetical protein
VQALPKTGCTGRIPCSAWRPRHLLLAAVRPRICQLVRVIAVHVVKAHAIICRHARPGAGWLTPRRWQPRQQCLRPLPTHSTPPTAPRPACAPPAAGEHCPHTLGLWCSRWPCSRSPLAVASLAAAQGEGPSHSSEQLTVVVIVIPRAAVDAWGVSQGRCSCMAGQGAGAPPPPARRLHWRAAACSCRARADARASPWRWLLQEQCCTRHAAGRGGAGRGDRGRCWLAGPPAIGCVVRRHPAHRTLRLCQAVLRHDVMPVAALQGEQAAALLGGRLSSHGESAWICLPVWSVTALHAPEDRRAAAHSARLGRWLCAP